MQRVKPIIVKAPQRSEEWHQARLGNVTGSMAKDCFIEISDTAKNAAIRKIMNIKAVTASVRENPDYQKLFEQDGLELFAQADMEPIEPAKRLQYRRTRVAERLTNLPADPEPYVTYDMKWGQVNETYALTRYKLETKNRVEEAYFLLHPELRAGASPDGMVTDTKTGLMGVLENKSLRSHNHLYEVIKYNDIPDDYLVQCHMEIWLSGTDFCDFIAYDPRLPEKLQFFYKRLERDDEYLENVLVPQVTAFLEEVDKDERYFRMLAKVGREEMLKWINEQKEKNEQSDSADQERA